VTVAEANGKTNLDIALEECKVTIGDDLGNALV
jgi:hypothetical protein